MRTAIAYRRVSTDEQADKGYSLSQQTKAIRDYAAGQGITIVEDYYDDCTGSSLARPGLEAARQRLRAGGVDCLICWDSDRLTREPGHYILLRDELKDLGKELHYVKRGQVDLGDFGHELVEDFYGRFAHEWKRKLIENCTNGRREMAQQGHVVTHGQPPFGYREATIDGLNTLEIYEPEAETIRLIYRLYLIEDKGYTAVARHLSKLGIKTAADKSKHTANKKRGKGQWSPATIQRIIKREAYAGVWRYAKSSDNPIEVPIPAIIDKKTWRLAQEKRKSNVGGRASALYDYLLSGRGTCCHCGGPIGAQSVKWKSKNSSGITLYYKCLVKVHKSRVGESCDCKKPYFNARKVEAAVWGWVSGLLLDENLLREGLQRYKERSKADEGPLKAELSRLDSTIAKRRKRLARARDLYLDGDESKAFFLAEKKQTEAALSQLETDRQRVLEQLDAVSLTDNREASIYELASQVRGAIRLLDKEPDPKLKRRIINTLDVRARFEFADGKQVVYGDCILDFNALLNLPSDYTSSGRQKSTG